MLQLLCRCHRHLCRRHIKFPWQEAVDLFVAILHATVISELLHIRPIIGEEDEEEEELILEVLKFQPCPCCLGRWRHPFARHLQNFRRRDRQGQMAIIRLFPSQPTSMFIPPSTLAAIPMAPFLPPNSLRSLVITEKAAFEDMCTNGFIQKDCTFAGHSLGEYSALASIGDVLHISALVDVVFHCGITMLERDSENRSNYAACAVNPSHVWPTFSDAAPRKVVNTIATISGFYLRLSTTTSRQVYIFIFYFT